MAYTKGERRLYEAIKREAIEQGDTGEQAEITARDYLYYTRRELRESKDDLENRSSNGWHIIAK